MIPKNNIIKIIGFTILCKIYPNLNQKSLRNLITLKFKIDKIKTKNEKK